VEVEELGFVKRELEGLLGLLRLPKREDAMLMERTGEEVQEG